MSLETDAAPAFFVSTETHTAVVIMFGSRVYKIKKPVDLGFLDFTSLEARRIACHREVDLNRRIAPDVYLGVADVRSPDGAVCDHLVVMRRMPADRRLSTMVQTGTDVDEPLRHVAHQLAGLHAATPSSADVRAEGSRDAIRRRWTQSFEQVRGMPHALLDESSLNEIENRTYEFLDGRGPLFHQRTADGYIVDGHGDLLADDIFCLDDGPRVLDCLEFDDRLRWLDGLDDAAFLAMDLEHLGAPDLAGRFLDWYAEFSSDPAPTALRHHFIAYRAFVRAKVAGVRYEQGDQPALAAARELADLTARHLRDGTIHLMVVGGPPATGTTTLGRELADRLGAVILSSDRIRKELAGLPADRGAAAPYRSGIYTPEWTDRTYQELLARAETLLGLGESVVLDASWSRARHRELARSLASRTHSHLVELRCLAPDAVTTARLRERGRTESDADEGVAAAMAADTDAWPEASPVHTDQPLTRATDEAMTRIQPG